MDKYRLRLKKKGKTEDKTDDIAGFITALADIQDCQHNLTCPAGRIMSR